MWKNLEDELPDYGEEVIVEIRGPYERSTRSRSTLYRVATFCHPRCQTRWRIHGIEANNLVVKKWKPFGKPEEDNE